MAPANRSDRHRLFLQPLDKALGTETNVRVLRALGELDMPIGVSELSRYIQMNKAGVWRAVAALQELGIIEEIGMGKQKTVRLRKAYPLNRYLAQLFRAERSRFEQFVQKLKDTAAHLKPPPKSIWIERTTKGENELGEPIRVGVLADSSDVGRLAETFSREIAPIEKQFDFPLEVRGITVADLSVLSTQERESLANVILVAGVPPLAFVPAEGTDSEQSPHSPPTMHYRRDEESLAVARVLSDKIRRNPSIVKKASIYLKRRLHSASPREAKELQEWLRVLQTYPMPRLRTFLTSTSERAIRLRQSSPFFATLSVAERASVLREAREQMQSRVLLG